MIIWAAWINAIIGIWLIISSFALGFETPQGFWNNIIAGILVVVFAIMTRKILDRNQN